MGNLTFLALLLWGIPAHASDAAEFADTMLSIPSAAWLIVAFAAGFGGMISIISKRAKVPPQIEVSITAFSYSMMWSYVAGTIGFLLALALNLPAAAIPISVFGCAVTGKPVVDWTVSLVKRRFDSAGPTSSA